MTFTSEDDAGDRDVRELFRAHEHLASEDSAASALLAARAATVGGPPVAQERRTRRWLVPVLAAAAVLAIAVPVAVIRPWHPASTPSVSPWATGDHMVISEEAPASTKADLERAISRYESLLGPDVIAVLRDQPLRQEGDWEPLVAENNKMALITGHLTWVGQATPAATSPATVRTPEGEVRRVDVMDVRRTIDEITTGAFDCGGCTPLRLTGATLTTMDLGVGGGESGQPRAGLMQVPAWRFTVEGSSVTILRAALPATALLVRPALGSPTGHVSVEWASLAPDGRSLDLTFVGAKDDPGPCGADYVASWAAGERALAVSVDQTARPSSDGVACNAMGHERTVRVDLPQPLGRLAVIDATSWMPVPVVRR